MTRRNVLAAMVLTTLATACAPRKERVRYRMTVVVDTPEGSRTGTAVRESIYRYPPYIPFGLGEDRGSVKVRGEAVAVELPGGRTVFVLLSGIGREYDFAARIPDRFLGHGEGRLPVESASIWPISDPSGGFPRIAFFANPSDYQSVKSIIPNESVDSLDEKFRLRLIKVERTIDPVTFEIANRIPSSGDNETYKKWLQSLSAGSEPYISPDDLIRGQRHG